MARVSDPARQPEPTGAAPLGSQHRCPSLFEVRPDLVVAEDPLQHVPLLLRGQPVEDRLGELHPLLPGQPVDQGVEQVEVRVGIRRHPADVGLDLLRQLEHGRVHLAVAGTPLLLAISPPSHGPMLAPRGSRGDRAGVGPVDRYAFLDRDRVPAVSRGRSAASTSATPMVP